MLNKIMKACLAVLMLAAIVVLIVMMVAHIKEGLATQTAKTYLAFYIVLILWASVRMVSLIKQILSK